MDVKLNYDDITLVPEAITTIASRSECDCYDMNGMAPIFASPMDTVVGKDSFLAFHANRINVIFPRTLALSKRINYLNMGFWVALSLSEAKKVLLEKPMFFLGNEKISYQRKVCIDMANGHMKDLIDTIKAIKDKYGDEILIMSGNIAEPLAYKYYEEAGCDYVRVGIGGGSACSTSSNTGIHYPYFSLIKEIYEIKQSINGKCKVIADGNIRGYRDIQKALIYADYVMIGGLFNKCLESEATATYGKSYWNIRGFKLLRPITTLLTYGKEIPREKYREISARIKKGTLTVWKNFYGMSTKVAQKAIADGNGLNVKLKTSEGLVKHQKVEYTIEGWIENELDYLRSAMSYTNSRSLDEYKDSKWVQINQMRYNN